MAKEKFYCWPDWMPLAQSNGYTYEPTDRRTKTDMEVGSVLRVNFDTDETILDCTLILDTVQAQWFELFERNMLNQGAKWFQMPIQIAGCIEFHTVRFASQPKATWKAPHYTSYSLKLDVQKRDLQMCEELAEFLLCITPKQLRDSAIYARIFTLGLRPLQQPKWIIAATCAYLYSFLEYVPEDELCFTGHAIASAMNEFIRNINLPPAHEVS